MDHDERIYYLLRYTSGVYTSTRQYTNMTDALAAKLKWERAPNKQNTGVIDVNITTPTGVRPKEYRP